MRVMRGPEDKTMRPLWLVLGSALLLSLLGAAEARQRQTGELNTVTRVSQTVSQVRRVRGRVTMYTPGVPLAMLQANKSSSRYNRKLRDKYRDSARWRSKVKAAQSERIAVTKRPRPFKTTEKETARANGQNSGYKETSRWRSKSLGSSAQQTTLPAVFTDQDVEGSTTPTAFTTSATPVLENVKTSNKYQETNRWRSQVSTFRPEQTSPPTARPLRPDFEDKEAAESVRTQVSVQSNISSRYSRVSRPRTRQSVAETNYLALRRNYNSNKARQYSSTTPRPSTAAAKHKRSIKDEVGSMINQLKADLENLLKFNENLVDFNSSIVKKAVKTKVESFFSTVSTAIDSQVEEESSGDSVEAAASILDVTQDIGRSVAKTLDIGDQSEMQTANISMLVMKKGLSLSTGDGATYNAHGYGLSRWEGGGGVKVELPDQESLTGDSNNTITLGFTSYTNLGSMMSDNKTGIIRSPVLSVNVVESKPHAQKRSIALTKPIEFTIQHRPMKKVRKRKCTFWEFKYAKWSSDGCYELRKKSTQTSTACQCYHLTDFAIAVELDNGLDAEPPSSPGLVSWEYLNYLSPETSPAPAPLTDDLQFGDKLWPTKTPGPDSGPEPQPVFRITPPATQAPEEAGPLVISLPPASEVTSPAPAPPEQDRSRPDIVPVLNNRKFMGDSFSWANFQS